MIQFFQAGFVWSRVHPFVFWTQKSTQFLASRHVPLLKKNTKKWEATKLFKTDLELCHFYHKIMNSLDSCVMSSLMYFLTPCEQRVIGATCRECNFAVSKLWSQGKIIWLTDGTFSVQNCPIEVSAHRKTCHCDFG